MTKYFSGENMLVPVYDILNCGPRHRFVANGKLVHNSDGVNLQNLPARDPKGKALKNSILPPVGHVFLDCDSAQIESRTLAWLAGQDDLVEAYRSKADVYKRMASVIYGKPVDEISKVERQVGKVVVLSCGYGVGHKKLQRFLKVQAGVEVSEAEAKRIVDTYRAANGRIVDLWRRSDAALGHLAGGAAFTVDIPGIIRVEPGKGMTLPSGLHIQYPNLRRVVTEEGKAAWVYDSKGEQVYVYGGKVVENYTQAVARCVVAEQMLRIARRYKVVLTVHDSVGCVAPAGEAEQAQAYVEECMRWVPAWANGLPLSCESGVGASYGAC